MTNMAAFASELRQHGLDAQPELKHDAVRGLQAGLVVDGYFYSLSELDKPENQQHLISRNFQAIRKTA